MGRMGQRVSRSQGQGPVRAGGRGKGTRGKGGKTVTVSKELAGGWRSDSVWQALHLLHLM